MAAILYPTSLPCPQSLPIQSVERRAVSDRPFSARSFQRDRLAYQQVTFPPLNATEAEALRKWWDETLEFGGAWFSATWPLPQGRIPAVRRFRAPLRWDFIPGGYWRVTGECEVRGLGAAPKTSPYVDCDLLIHFDEGDRARWRDHSKHRRNLAFAEPPGSSIDPAAGTFGGAARFVQPHPGAGTGYLDTSAYIQPDGPRIDFGADEFFVSAFTTLDGGAVPSGSNNQFAILGTRGNGNTAGFLFRIVSYTPGSEILSFFCSGSDAGTYEVSGGDPIDLTAKHFVSASRKHGVTEDQIRLFIDGGFIAITAIPHGVAITLSGDRGTLVGATDYSPGATHTFGGYHGVMEELYAVHGNGTGIAEPFATPTVPMSADLTLRQWLGLSDA